MINKYLVTACIALAGLLSGHANAYVLTQTDGSNGSVQILADGFKLSGTDYGDDFNAVNGGSYQSFYTQLFAVDTLISFNWNYASNDMLTGWGIPGQDAAGYVLWTGAATSPSGKIDLADYDTADVTLSGSVSNLLVAAGQSFGWYVESVDGLNGGASLTVSQLTATPATSTSVPEPTGLALVLAGLGLVGLHKRARRQVQ